MAQRTGSVKRHRGKWTARVTFTDPATGKRREIRRTADPNIKARACEIRDEILRELDSGGPSRFDHDVRTFDALVEHFVQHYAVPPKYRDGRQISGMRSYVTARAHCAILRGFFGRTPLKSITVDDLRKCRMWLLDQPVERRDGKGNLKTTRPRSIATVNREMSILRRLLNVALHNRWIAVNPFDLASKGRGLGETLIPTADEKSRDRVLSPTEEARLLAQCVEPRAHLRPIIICALDTGMRRGEILKLRWKDVDLENRTINIVESHTKTLRGRTVGITDRLAAELQRLGYTTNDPTSGDAVFGPSTTVKRSFASALKRAGIQDFKFHDMRHTSATRMSQSGMSLTEVARILGHANASRVTYRYTNLDDRTIERSRLALDEWQRQNVGQESLDVN